MGASKKLGICRFTIYDWQRKASLHADGKIADSPVVGSDEDHRAARDRRILDEWKAHPAWGPARSATSCAGRISRSACTPCGASWRRTDT